MTHAIDGAWPPKLRTGLQRGLPFRMLLGKLLPKSEDDRSRAALVRHLSRRADAARDERRFMDAAVLYAEAARLLPERAALHVQHGHMLKEAGQMDAAERAYAAALELSPNDADLALQLGHFHKTAGRPNRAAEAYRRALTLKPGWAEPTRELGRLEQARAPRAVATLVSPPAAAAVDGAAGETMLSPGEVARLVPALAPRSPDAILHEHRIGVEVRRFGQPEASFWGNARTLRGVEAVRGFCVSPKPVVDVQILLNGLAVYRGPLRGGYVLQHERDKSRVLKYVFNVWIDFSDYAPGRYAAEIRCADIEQELHTFHDEVVIAPSLDFEENAGSDAQVPVSDPDPVLLAARIRALPSVVRSPERTLLDKPPRTVLLMRTDQLGDVISSTPSIRRLREMMPQARFVGLLTAANVDIARTIGLFDEIIIADFPDDKFERRRIMPLAEQERLRRRLEPYHFDLAIDLSQSDVSRPLLRLSGAKFLYGVSGGEWPWLTGEFGLNTHDPRNRLDRVPHSAKTLALVETLGAMLHDRFEVVRRSDLDRRSLERFGIGADERYVVLHMGARIEFSRWPRYAELATRLLGETNTKVVMMTEDASVRAGLLAGLAEHPRFLLLDQRLDFDEFDAFVSFAAALVGNDSGPKHLASFRGVPAVTLFTARINWKEWGQERGGFIISRRVPCAGCALFHDPEECGQDFTCIRDITVDEVFEATVAAAGLTVQGA